MDENRLTLVEHYISAMHQNETKALSVSGFYIGLFGIVVTAPKNGNDQIWVDIGLILFSVICTRINRGYRGWKIDYLRRIKRQYKKISFIQQSDLPIAFRNKSSNKKSLISVDWIITYIPVITSVGYYSVYYFFKHLRLIVYFVD